MVKISGNINNEGKSTFTEGMKMADPVYWFDEKDLKTKILSEYSPEKVQKHLDYLTTLTRQAGSEDERKAAEYIKGRLDNYGIEVNIYEVDAYISIPKESELNIQHPIKKSLPCLSAAFTPPTPAAGIEGELILPDSLNQKTDLKGKIALIGGDKENRRSAENTAREKGAAAKIYITPGKSGAISVERLKSAWGNPTPETIDQIPKTPAISISNGGGHYLKQLLKQGSVRIKLTADSLREYRQVNLPVGTLEGSREPEKFVLLSGHYCSWFTGATDNAAANSLMIEMARIFAKYREFLGRSIRFAWWSGHEQGAFAGSTWYLDNFWDDVRDNAVAYITMDGLGRIGSSGYECRNTEEVRNFHEKVVKDALGIQVKSQRIPKTGDQSFHGVGLPAFTGKQDLEVESEGDLYTEAIWYSHSALDTTDHLDTGLLESPFKVNSLSILRLCNRRVLPFEFVTLAEAIHKALTRLQKIGKPMIDLSLLIDNSSKLVKNADQLKAVVEKKRTPVRNEQQNNQINTGLLMLSRILIPIFSSKGGKYSQDPREAQFKPLPGLQPIEEFSALDPNSQESKALFTFLVRQRNRVSDAIQAANQVITDTLNNL
jgi:Iap family predicted aminopeptidase